MHASRADLEYLHRALKDPNGTRCEPLVMLRVLLDSVARLDGLEKAKPPAKKAPAKKAPAKKVTQK